MQANKGIQNRESRLESKRREATSQVYPEDLLTYVLDYSIQEGLEIVDRNGTIQYVNSAFTRITGVEASARVGHNIFDRVPDGLLAKTLRLGKPFKGERMIVPESGVEIITNTYPIIIGGVMVGAVAVFHDLKEMRRLIADAFRDGAGRDLTLERIASSTGPQYRFEDIIGCSSKLLETICIAKRAAETDFTILLCGESGTGKELFAHAIHAASSRCRGPFVKVNCVAIPETLLESEFFGYEKGAFTGASRTKPGLFELANNGTLFLDEIGDMDITLQGKILRVLEDMEVQKIGGTSTTKVNFRIIAATNQDLLSRVNEGKFRGDLYYRLGVITIQVPPLRERKEDIPFLVNHFLTKIQNGLAKKLSGLTDGALEMLMDYAWPGNVRELRNLLQRAAIISDSPVLPEKDIASILPQVAMKKAHSTKDLQPIDEVERNLIQKALAEYGWSHRGKMSAAKALGISVRTLYNKIKKHKLSAMMTQ